MQVKRWFKILGVEMVKNGCGESCDGTVKLTVCEEWTDGINWFFVGWYKFTKNKIWSKICRVGMVKIGCGQSRHGETLKLNVSQKWTDGIHLFFACCYRFRKAKSWFNDFWMGVVKNDSSLLVHETLKSALS